MRFTDFLNEEIGKVVKDFGYLRVGDKVQFTVIEKPRSGSNGLVKVRGFNGQFTNPFTVEYKTFIDSVQRD